MISVYIISRIKYANEAREANQNASDLSNRLRTVLDSTLDGIITIDHSGIILSFNKAAQTMFGYQADEVIGKNIRLLTPESIRHHHDGYIKNYLDTGEAKIIGIGREM